MKLNPLPSQPAPNYPRVRRIPGVFRRAVVIATSSTCVFFSSCGGAQDQTAGPQQHQQVADRVQDQDQAESDSEQRGTQDVEVSRPNEEWQQHPLVIVFELGSSSMSSEDERRLHELGLELARRSDLIRVRVSVNPDTTEPVEHLELAEARAQTVINALVASAGLSLERFETQILGHRTPGLVNQPMQERPPRVELFLLVRLQ